MREARKAEKESQSRRESVPSWLWWVRMTVGGVGVEGGEDAERKALAWLRTSGKEERENGKVCELVEDAEDVVKVMVRVEGVEMGWDGAGDGVGTVMWGKGWAGGGVRSGGGGVWAKGVGGWGAWLCFRDREELPHPMFVMVKTRRVHRLPVRHGVIDLLCTRMM